MSARAIASTSPGAASNAAWHEQALYRGSRSLCRQAPALSGARAAACAARRADLSTTTATQTQRHGRPLCPFRAKRAALSAGRWCGERYFRRRRCCLPPKRRRPRGVQLLCGAVDEERLFRPSQRRGRLILRPLLRGPCVAVSFLAKGTQKWREESVVSLGSARVL